MATLDYLRNKWVKPLIDRHRAEGRAEGRVEGRAEGREEGRAEGREEGRTEVYEQLRRWLERRDAAEEAGLPFDEPPPSPDDLR